ncbi:rod shape-determining protein [Streptobacillus moniliformis]|uniref:Cell shape-determining protein MreB n=1 Tax=Streptobacillus moniliformis (strain ATCC 14647 / DSM 12112 / NCTC 10651 / 9901) TaxID=519441 RepID=D1AXT8_STRM9|nr:rod shape-determining protein [Streptobacillus moniliformis]ACZ01114.1 cell shape determining protein, MreB/Mrl family [Streptobacillus moniliformis DSM 12112]AVL42520.1 rod shape-determining protein [Streptobacillus moniliformis]QXW65884.1 rod shape-determining protein [Streptobacillus moniliformis]SQA13744.1 Rod shape-determining protein MreB [Streptobacillus moniliformis]
MFKKNFIKRLIRSLRINKSISIDLGTANLLIYDKQEDKIVLNEPSVLARDRKTGKVIAVGKEAREMLGKTPDSIEAIKPLKDGVIADLDATREMLSHFMYKIYGSSIFKPEVMICVPLEVTPVERKALFDSVSGAKKIYIIEEGRAAIIGSGIDISKPAGNMVIDIGGGSTDVAILSLDEVIASKSIRIAGNKFDEDIIRYVRNKYNLLIGDRTAEKIKKELATAIYEEVPKVMSIKGRQLEVQTPVSIQIDSNEVNEAIKSSLYSIINAVKEVLEKSPPELAADILDNGIVMTGGGSMIKNFTTLVEQEVQVKVYLSEHPLDSVVLGGGKAFDNKKLLETLQMREN